MRRRPPTCRGCRHESLHRNHHRDAPAGRSRGHDLREVGPRPPRRPASAHRGRRDTDRRAHPVTPAAWGPGRAAGGLRTGDHPPLQPHLEAELRPRHRLLSARLLHHEVQPAPQRAGRGAARPRPAPSGDRPGERPGRAEADVAAPAVARRDLRPAAREPPALGRIAGRAGRPAPDPRLPRRQGPQPDQGPDSRHFARNQPGVGVDGRIRGREGRHQPRRWRRHRRPAQQGRRRRRLPDADQPEHAGCLRREHRRDGEAGP